MKVKKEVTLSTGEKVIHAVDNRNEEWVFWLDEEGDIIEESGQDFISDISDYRYTHGGCDYREAIEKLNSESIW